MKDVACPVPIPSDEDHLLNVLLMTHAQILQAVGGMCEEKLYAKQMMKLLSALAQ